MSEVAAPTQTIKVEKELKVGDFIPTWLKIIGDVQIDDGNIYTALKLSSQAWTNSAFVSDLTIHFMSSSEIEKFGLKVLEVATAVKELEEANAILVAAANES